MDVGDLIQDRYRLTASLGAGGMAEVWRAEDLRLDRPVAVKILSESLTEEPENLVRFFSEAQAVARIQHPNVVTVLDFGEVGGRPYLVMEHVPGGTVSELLGEPLLPERALEMVAGAAAGAGAAHDIGIVHRDIKPGNILLDDRGNPRLADFGIAFSTGDEHMTQTGLALGSPHYLSPEQAQGRTARPASDVYSLGVVLYELLTGVKPFDGDNVTAVAIAHVDRAPVPPSAHAPDLPPEIDALVLRCLSKDPSRRFSDGNALASAITSDDPWAYAPPVEAAEHGPRVPVGVVTGAVAVVAVALALFAAAILGGGDVEPAGADEVSPGSTARPSPTVSATPVEAPAGSVTEPTPTPAETEEQKKKDEKDEKGSTSGDGDEPEEEPTPTPEPTPSPQPSPTAEPTPQRDETTEASG